MDALVLIEQAGREITEKTNEQPYYQLASNLITAAASALAQAETVYEMKDIRDKLGGIEVYLKNQKAELVACNLLTAQRLRTEREIGQRLHKWFPAGTKLADYGISKKLSMNWQRIAKIDDEDFETWIQDNLETRELHRAALLRVWKMLFQPRKEKGDLFASQYVEDVRKGDAINQIEALIWTFRYAETWFDMLGCGGTRTCILRDTLNPEYIDDGWMKQLAEKIKPLTEVDLDEKICELCEKLTNSALDIVEEVFLYNE